MNSRGKVNLVSLALILAVVGGLGALINLAPAYLDNFDVDEALAAAINVAAKGGRSDDQLAQQILQKTNHVGTHWGEDSFGKFTELPGLGLERENVIVERDSVQGRIAITVDYERVMRLKPLKRMVRLHFAPRREGTIPP